MRIKKIATKFGFILLAAEKGWVSGMGGGKFEPNEQDLNIIIP